MDFAEVKPIAETALSEGKISQADMGKIQSLLMGDASLSDDQVALLSNVIDGQARGEIELA